MATTKPRITITLECHLYATIRRFAELQHRPMSACIVEILDSIHPPLIRTVALLDAARSAPDEVKQGLRGVLESIEREMVQASGSGQAQLDWLTQQTREASGGAGAQPAPARAHKSPKKPAAKGRRQRATPRSCNTGGRSPTDGGDS
jgi:hypothetical protein